MLTKKQTQIAALIGIVFIIILATVFVGRGLTKKHEQIFQPPKDKQNFLQEYSAPAVEQKLLEEDPPEPSLDPDTP